MANPWYFFYQRRGKEDTWNLELGANRAKVVTDLRPAFCTVLDLSMVPEDNDWSKVRYRGPLYFDFDADGDIELACQQVKAFIGKLDGELGFDLTQAAYFASGSKGFHVEIPQECFISKPPAQGFAYLPYVYRAMAEALYVDTLDLNVYTGKRGRQWRTTNVQRENGCYKVPLTLDEVIEISPEAYEQLIKAPRMVPTIETPALNTKFALLFERSRAKTADAMRSKKKRQEKSATLLAPWKKAKQHPPTIVALMAGQNVGDGVGFQKIAMQLAIYAVSIGMELPELLERCTGLCETHVSDSRRYNSSAKRREELTRMYEYMAENTLYDFEVGPIVKLLKPGTSTADLGVIDETDEDDKGDRPPISEVDAGDGDADPTPTTTVEIDHHRSVRKGFFMNGDGMFTRIGDNVQSVCRATLRQVESLVDVTTLEFKGYEFDIVHPKKRTLRTRLSADAFTSAVKLKQFFSAHQITFQGGDAEAGALLDIMSEKATRGGNVYTYPREGFFILNHPEKDTPTPVKCYLTQDTFISSIPRDSEDYFELRYRPVNAISSYCIDLHKAPDLCDDHKERIADLLTMNKPEVLADMLGWFVAAHYRSVYLRLFSQFPLLQLYATAGSGKTKSVEVLSCLHWYHKDKVSVKSAMSSTDFALDHDVSSSHSAPLIIDEFKPRELRSKPGRYAKLKDVFKANYVGADVGNRGTLNKGAETNLAVIKSKATAPIVFMAEAIENESAIYERSVVVGLSSSYLTASRRAAHERCLNDGEPISALGKAIVQMGFLLNLETMDREFRAIRKQIEDSIPDIGDAGVKRAAPRLIHNRAVIVYGLTTLKRVLQKRFAAEFDPLVDELIATRLAALQGDEGQVAIIQGMSEVAKVLNRIALLSRDTESINQLLRGKDYVLDDAGWLELKVERSYDKYKRYCVQHGDTPLFDTLDQFIIALMNFEPLMDRVCANSVLREDGSTETIVRLNAVKLGQLGVRSFRA